MRKLIVLFIILSIGNLYPKIDIKQSAIIETEEAYTKYLIQFNYLITQNYIYLAGLYEKENYYFHSLAKERWAITKDLAQKVMKNKSKLEMDNLIDKAYKIALGEINYNKTEDRELNI